MTPTTTETLASLNRSGLRPKTGKNSTAEWLLRLAMDLEAIRLGMPRATFAPSRMLAEGSR